ncbi:NAD(P)-dependent oxidoreductase [Nonomuraea sp. NEAU-A123]|uniref:NAD-dependent epimerase/dehydratase family protein n=1 Tax=Nonomuraea sp. NEAU-A123 TaxID=2839649 RepID=UPI001BE48C0C|nr:NAD(P)-dependent oxidoreductase [Nonomuraea sp. NEAU-A123]MBT2225304.1 NAD(P)-dependent oxidoreductase [Nonomuraea sp. NEAU-A123]
MHVFVAGASGAVGRLLVPLLIGAGHRVTGGSRSDAGLESLRAQGATPVRLDVFDAAGTRRALADVAPDAIIHQLTALSGGALAENSRIRRVGTRNLVDAAKEAGVGRIVAQSIAWAYAPGDAPATESVPLDVGAPEPRAGMVGGVHALEEASAELEHHVILRYGMFYGPGTWYSPDGLAAARLRGEPAAGFPGKLVANDAVTSFLHVADAARAAVAALDWPSGPVNVVDDEPAPAFEWLPVLAKAVGAPVPGPDGRAGRAGWERGADNGLARATLGWRPVHPTWRTGFDADRTSGGG